MWLPFFYICNMALISKTDFKGNVKISQNTKETNDLGLYIERNQKELLSDLIGDVVYNRYLADSSQSKFKVLTEGLNGDESQFWYYDNSDVVINYYGLKEALKYSFEVSFKISFWNKI